MGEADIGLQHRRLSSLTPDEHQTVVVILSLLGAEICTEGIDDHHLTLNVARPFGLNALRIPRSCTIDELIGWARLLNRDEAV